MKKIYLLLCTVFFLCSLANSSFAQAPASATWALTNPSAEGTGLTVTTTGQVTAADENLVNLEINQYTGVGLSQRLRIIGNAWPANQTDTIPGTYVQFAVSPIEGNNLNVNTISFDMAAAGIATMKAKVFYSTSLSFKNATELVYTTGAANNYLSSENLTEVAATVNATVNSGQTFYLRIYPWVEDPTVRTGKYVTLKDVVISGTTSQGGGGTVVPKKVVYLTTPKTSLVATAAPTTDDPIIRMLKADPFITLTVMEVAADATVDLSGYDAAIVQESFSSGANILKPAGSLGLSNITIPFLYNKSYALRSSGAVPGSAGAAKEAGGLSITVPTVNQNNNLFKGITFTNNSFNVFKTTANDNGGDGDKSFNFSSGLELSNTNTLLATHEGITDQQTTIFINDIPQGTMIGPTASPQTLKARMIALGMNFGAMVKDNGANWTAEGLTLWRNAIYTLAGLPVPNTLVVPSIVTSLSSETNNATFNLGQNYPNPSYGSTTIQYNLKKASQVSLVVYDITGKKVATLAEGAKAAGTYEVKVSNNLKDGIYFYKLTADGVTATRKMLIAR